MSSLVPVTTRTLKIAGASLAMLPRGDRWKLFFVAVAQLFTAFMDLGGVLLLGLVVAVLFASVSGDQLPDWLTNIATLVNLQGESVSTLILVFSALAGALLTLKSFVSAVLSRKTLKFLAFRQALVSANLARQTFGQSLSFVQSRSSQELIFTLLGSVNAAVIVILGQGFVIVTEALLLTVLAVGMVIVDWQVALGAVAYFLVVGALLQRVISNWAGRLGSQIGSTEVESYACIQESIFAYREIFVASLQKQQNQRFKDLRIHSGRLNADMQFVGLVPKYIFEVALVVGGGLLALSFVPQGLTAEAVGTIAVFLVAGSRVAPSLMRLQGAIASVRGAMGQAAFAFDLQKDLQFQAPLDDDSVQALGALDRSPRRRQPAEKVGQIEALVEVKELSLQYPGAKTPALDCVSFQIFPGAVVALIGPSGSGKSTLVDCMLGIANPSEGKVLIHGVSPSDSISQNPGDVGYVPQQSFLFPTSIRENVALGRSPSDETDNRVWQVLEMLDLDSLFRDERDGLDTLVGENGAQLSGGQRQRVGIARALFSRPSLLILDEATSALDVGTEQKVMNALQHDDPNRTLVIAAHRLTTIAKSDAILYFESGSLIGEGSFEELRAKLPNLESAAQLSRL